MLNEDNVLVHSLPKSNPTGIEISINGIRMQPLHLASSCGKTNIVAVILDAGCNVNAVDEEQRTALHHAVSGCHVDTVKKLLATGCLIYPADLHETKTALHYAAENGSVEIVRELLAAAAEGARYLVKLPDRYGRQALHCAAFFNHVDVIRILLAAGADVKALIYTNRTVLSEAIENDAADAIAVLLEAGADANGKLSIRLQDIFLISPWQHSMAKQMQLDSWWQQELMSMPKISLIIHH